MNTDTTKATQKKRSPITIVIGVIAVAVLVVALVNIIGISGEYAQSQTFYSSLQESVTSGEIQPGAELDVTGQISGGLNIDWAALHQLNPEIVAWIYIPDSNINYPVVQTDNNSYYLSHNVDGTQNKSGSIFMEMNNLPDFSHQNTVIYGHNMKDQSMFAQLHEYTDEAFFRAHPTIYIYTPQAQLEYRVFSSYITESNSDTYLLGFENTGEFMNYVQSAQQKSVVQSDIAIAEQDNILTLSTCIKGGHDTKRYVVVAVQQ